MTDYEIPSVVRDDYPDNPPRCRCGHGPSLHSRGVDKCWSVACACLSFVLKEGEK